MRKIAGPGAVSGRFVDYDAVTNPNGTVYTADYGNDIQDELIGIQDAANITEAAGTNLQVLLALYRLQNNISDNVTAWNSGTTYSTAGTLAYIENSIYAATGKTGNLNKDPTDPDNATFWENYDIRNLRQAFITGAPVAGGVSPIHDIDDSLYQQYFQIFQSIENGVEYEYYFVHLDGTTLSGTLATLMTDYPHLATWAPGSVLLDARNRNFRIQGSDAGVVGNVLEDAFQEIGVYSAGSAGAIAGINNNASTVAGSNSTTAPLNYATQFTFTSQDILGDPSGSNPLRTATETRTKSISLAIPGIIIKIAA